jgi:hypothetical protein
MFKRLRRRRASNNFLPYSKRLLEYSRIECWVMTLALFVMQGTGIDTGQLYQVALAGWTGYAVAKALYYNMAKSDHQIQLLKKVDPAADGKIKDIITDDLENKLKDYIGKEIDSGSKAEK